MKYSNKKKISPEAKFELLKETIKVVIDSTTDEVAKRLLEGVMVMVDSKDVGTNGNPPGDVDE